MKAQFYHLNGEPQGEPRDVSGALSNLDTISPYRTFDHSSTLNYVKQPVDGDNTNPVLTIDSFEYGNNSYPSYIISGKLLMILHFP